VYIKDQAVVLQVTELGESDRIVTMLTENYGKIRGVAKGVRKSKSRFGAASHMNNMVWRSWQNI
jgi:DNA repair protein RecO (recombination protein O)